MEGYGEGAGWELVHDMTMVEGVRGMDEGRWRRDARGGNMNEGRWRIGDRVEKGGGEGKQGGKG